MGKIEYHLFICILLLSGFLHPCAADNKWMSFVSTKFIDRSASSIRTRDGGIILAGEWDDPDQTVNTLVIRLNKKGEIAWQKILFGDGTGSSVQQTSDGGFVLANPGILKLTSTGLVEWHLRYVSGFAKSVQETKDKGFLVTGHIPDTGAWVLKLDKLGNVQWQNTYSCSLDEGAFFASEVADGGFLIAGTTRCNAPFGGTLLLKINSTGDLEWHKIFSNPDVNISARHLPVAIGMAKKDGSLLAISEDLSGVSRLKLLRLDSLGNIIWQKNYEFPVAFDTSAAIRRLKHGVILFAQLDGLLWLDSSGEVLRARNYSINGRAVYMSGVDTSRRGGLVAAGMVRRQDRQLDLAAFKVPRNSSRCIDVAVGRTKNAQDSTITVSTAEMEVLPADPGKVLNLNFVASDFGASFDTCGPKP